MKIDDTTKWANKFELKTVKKSRQQRNEIERAPKLHAIASKVPESR